MEPELFPVINRRKSTIPIENFLPADFQEKKKEKKAFNLPCRKFLSLFTVKCKKFSKKIESRLTNADIIRFGLK